MRDFQGKVCVVTGAASGIGRALAERAAREGMKIVLADVEKEALARATLEIQATGAEALAVRIDVSKAADVETLAQKTLDRFGKVHLLFNNAGVGGGTTAWETTLADWQWILNVNLMGVVHGVHTFAPIMLRQNEPSHIVNTASILGLISSPGFAAYKVSKFGVVALSETLYHEMQLAGGKVGVSVLCPGGVHTNIVSSERNRPADIGEASVMTESHAAIREQVLQAVEAGINPSEVAEMTFQAIREDRFYILTHPDYTPAIGLRAQDILTGRNPTNPGS